jgi:hypothetical protein
MFTFYTWSTENRQLAHSQVLIGMCWVGIPPPKNKIKQKTKKSKQNNKKANKFKTNSKQRVETVSNVIECRRYIL